MSIKNQLMKQIDVFNPQFIYNAILQLIWNLLCKATL